MPKKDRFSYSPAVLARAVLVNCSCGCGAEMLNLDCRGRQRYAIKGHFLKDRPHPWAEKPAADVNYWHTHSKARSIKGAGPCYLSALGWCNEHIIDVHHLDGNAWNNDIANLMHLCRLHHQLVEFGYIDPFNPQMPQPYIFPSGRRIWPNNKQYPKLTS